MKQVCVEEKESDVLVHAETHEAIDVSRDSHAELDEGAVEVDERAHRSEQRGEGVQAHSGVHFLKKRRIISLRWIR